MLPKFLPLFLFAFILVFQLKAQEKPPMKFGHVVPADFNTSKYNVDTTDGAIIISDIGESEFEGNNHSSFSIVFKRQRIIKVTNKNGFDLADISIPLYVGDFSKETVEDIKGVTYNLVNGQVVESKLNNNAIFEDKYNKHHNLKKFTLPAVKEGSIIEYSYTVNSDFLFNLQPWEFQGKYPRVWSEYSVEIPQYFDYVTLAQGYKAFDSTFQGFGTNSYRIRITTNAAESDGVVDLNARTSIRRWIIKNVPALKEERFTSSIDNFIDKIDFQLSGIQYPQEPYEEIMGNWKTASQKLLADNDFGLDVNRNNGWLDDHMETIIGGAKTQLDKTQKIYDYVKNNFKSTEYRGIYLDKSIKEVFKSKSGSIAEINMLLIAMLKHENINADPVILSTTDNGYTNEVYPLLDRFNYVICKTTVDSNTYFLDATEPYLGFGHLPPYCYNGQARVISENPIPVYLSADSLKESSLTNVILYNATDNSGKLVGSLTKYFGDNESIDMRNDIAEKGKSEYEKKWNTLYNNGEYSISNIDLDKVDKPEEDIKLNFKLEVNEDTSADIIYFNPMLKEGYDENFFKSVDRQYPVEMPYKMDDSYTLSVEIPKGYEIDELPKSAKVTLNEDDGYFEYLVSHDDNMVSMRSRIKLNKAMFLPEDYKSLRDFFDYIVKKHSEQFVFKKKK